MLAKDWILWKVPFYNTKFCIHYTIHLHVLVAEREDTCAYFMSILCSDWLRLTLQRREYSLQKPPVHCIVMNGIFLSCQPLLSWHWLYVLQVTSVACLSSLVTSGTAKVGVSALPHFAKLRLLLFVSLAGALFSLLVIFLNISHLHALIPMDYSKMVIIVTIQVLSVQLIQFLRPKS